MPAFRCRRDALDAKRQRARARPCKSSSSALVCPLPGETVMPRLGAPCSARWRSAATTPTSGRGSTSYLRRRRRLWWPDRATTCWRPCAGRKTTACAWRMPAATGACSAHRATPRRGLRGPYRRRGARPRPQRRPRRNGPFFPTPDPRPQTRHASADWHPLGRLQVAPPQGDPSLRWGDGYSGDLKRSNSGLISSPPGTGPPRRCCPGLGDR
jgi:hypothetical protein